MVLGSKQSRSKLDNFCLQFMGRDLLPEHTTRDLGVTLDSNLTYDEHVIETVSSCMSRLGQISRTKHAFDKRNLLIIIKTLVFSKFILLFIYVGKHIKKLQAVQNFACRIVKNARKYDHVTPILKELKWLPVASQLYHRNATMAFKCLTNCAKFIKRAEISGCNTRSSQKLNIPL